MEIFRSAGVAVGIMVGLILCVILYMFANTDKKIKTEYDERQKAIKGRGYMFAFYSIIICETILMIVTMSGITLPIEEYVIHIGTALIGLIVLCTYNIWNDVYWGLNNDRKRYIIIFVVAFIINIIAFIAQIRTNGGLMENGKIAFPALNLMVIILMVIVSAELIIKHFINSKNDTEEE